MVAPLFCRPMSDICTKGTLEPNKLENIYFFDKYMASRKRFFGLGQKTRTPQIGIARHKYPGFPFPLLDCQAPLIVCPFASAHAATSTASRLGDLHRWLANLLWHYSTRQHGKICADAAPGCPYVEMPSTHCFRKSTVFAHIMYIMAGPRRVTLLHIDLPCPSTRNPIRGILKKCVFLHKATTPPPSPWQLRADKCISHTLRGNTGHGESTRRRERMRHAKLGTESRPNYIGRCTRAIRGTHTTAGEAHSESCGRLHFILDLESAAFPSQMIALRRIARRTQTMCRCGPRHRIPPGTRSARKGLWTLRAPGAPEAPRGPCTRRDPPARRDPLARRDP